MRGARHGSAGSDAGACPGIEGGMDSEVWYFLIIVVGLPLLLLLLTGPGMWSEKWGWRTLEKLKESWRRLTHRRDRKP